MKDEIKLKDMTNFLENFYKDIKKQPTLEEELEKERKFINKIKGDNEDEMKELLDHIEILDNTDYILHSDKAKTLLDYITNLQKSDIDKQLEIMKLKDKLEQQRKEYQETYKDVRIEIKEKNEIITNLQEELDRCVKANVILDNENTELQGKITNLQEENEKLKELCDKYEEEHSNEFQCWKRDRKELLDKRTKIGKIDKLINTDYGCISYYYKYNNKYLKSEIKEDINNILNGDDKK